MTAPTAGQEPWERRSRRDARPSPPCVFPQRCTCEMKASMKLVFQYGSNCDTSEFNSKERLAGRAVDLGPAQTVNTFEIAFNKYSKIRRAKTFVVRSDRRKKRLFTNAKYVGHIVTGLRSHGVPEEYVQHVIYAAL